MRRDSGLTLLVAFAAVVFAFVGSTVLSQRAARQVGQLALTISRDAAPGVESMSALRAELRRIQALVDQHAIEAGRETAKPTTRSEEHTSELQSRQYLVCRLLLEKKKA